MTGARIQVFTGILLSFCLSTISPINAKPISSLDRRRPVEEVHQSHHLGRRPRRMDSRKEEMAWKFMRKYGYISDDFPERDFTRKYNEGQLYEEVYTLQKFMRLVPTGELDNATLEQMDSPRCGFPDKGITLHGPGHDGERQRRYIIDGGKWGQTTITYRIVNSPAQLSQEEVKSVIRESFDVWQEHIPLVFEEVTSGHADIYLSFRTCEHGDSEPFDGPGGTYAHAFGPQPSEWGDLAGDVHFDDSEEFVVNGVNGINLHWVASHEIGHSLGLGHSDVFGSLMWPYYGQSTWNGVLNYDDKLGIEAIYIGTDISDILDSSLPSSESSLSSSSSLESSDTLGSDTPQSSDDPVASSVSSSSDGPSSDQLPSEMELSSEGSESSQESTSEYKSTSEGSLTSGIEPDVPVSSPVFSSSDAPSSDQLPSEMELSSEVSESSQESTSEYKPTSEGSLTSSSSSSDGSSSDEPPSENGSSSSEPASDNDPKSEYEPSTQESSSDYGPSSEAFSSNDPSSDLFSSFSEISSLRVIACGFGPASNVASSTDEIIPGEYASSSNDAFSETSSSSDKTSSLQSSSEYEPTSNVASSTDEVLSHDSASSSNDTFSETSSSSDEEPSLQSSSEYEPSSNVALSSASTSSDRTSSLASSSEYTPSSSSNVDSSSVLTSSSVFAYARRRPGSSSSSGGRSSEERYRSNPRLRPPMRTWNPRGCQSGGCSRRGNNPLRPVHPWNTNQRMPGRRFHTVS